MVAPIVAAIPYIAAGVGSLVSSLSGGSDKAKATETATNAPASYESIPGSYDLWSDYMDSLTGSKQEDGPGYWEAKNQAYGQSLVSDPARWKIWSNVGSEIDRGETRYLAYTAFKKDGDQDKLLSSLDGYAPHKEIVDAINGRVSVDGLIAGAKTEMETARAKKEQLFPELRGMYSGDGTSPEKTGLEKYIAEDNAAGKAGWEDYLGTTGETTSKYVGSVKKNSDDYVGANNAAQGKYLDKPAFSFSLGNANLGVTPKGNRDMASLLFGKNLDQANFLNTAAGVEKGALDTQAGNKLTYDTTFTPNKDIMDYIKTLTPIVDKNNALRFGLPSTTTTASGTSEQSAEERLGNASSGIQSLIEAFNQFGNKKPATAETGTT